MAAPNFEQIQSFDNVSKQLTQAAIDEFLSEISPGMSYEAVIDVAVTVAEKFAFLGAELGAQWYDLCTQLAGVDAVFTPGIEDAEREIIKGAAEGDLVITLGCGDINSLNKILEERNEN